MKLLGTEQNGSAVDYYWKHIGDDGREKITVETREDGEHAIKRAKLEGEKHNPHSDVRHIASIPGTMISDAAKFEAQRWGVSVREAFSEILANRTDRAKKVWKMLTQGRDFNKLQSRSYR